MRLKIYKRVLFFGVLMVFGNQVLAQNSINNSESQTSNKASDNLKKLDDPKVYISSLTFSMNELGKKFSSSLKTFDQQLDLDNLLSDVAVDVTGLVNNLSTSDDLIANTNIQERVKNYSKSYPFDANDKLEINNKYGRVTVNTWSKNEVRVDVQIKGDAGNSETAQKFIDAITVTDTKENNVVSFKTNFASKSGSVWNLFNNMNGNHKVEVNYTVYMPSTNSLTLNNRYGAVILPSLSGKVILDNAYGSLTAKALTNSSNQLNFHYYEVNIDELTGGELNLSYGSLKLGNVGHVEANVNYAPVDIGKLASSGSFNVKYGGGIKINELSKSLKSLDINSTFSSVNVNLHGDENFNFDVTVKYNSFNYDENKVKITSKSPSDEERGYKPVKTYKGYVGNSNSNNKVTINSTYQSVKLE